MIPLGLYIDTYDNSIIEVTFYDPTMNNYSYTDLTTFRSGWFIPQSSRANSIRYTPGCYSIEDVYKYYPEYFV